LRIAALGHVLTLVFLGLFGIVTQLGWIYWVGLTATAALLKVEHMIVAEGDISKINTAFFTINGWIGILLFLFTFLEIFR
jgi:4-hydroxybenzoate polyprenyltransferase